MEHPHAVHQPQNKFVLYMSKLLRPLNFIGGVGTIATAVFVLMFQGLTFRPFLNLFFTSLLGVLLLAGEFNWKVINDNCKFLITLLGRVLYDLFVGGWVYSLHSFFVPNSESYTDELAYLVSYVVYIVNTFPFIFSSRLSILY